MKDLTQRRIVCDNCGHSYETHKEEIVYIRCPKCRSGLFFVQDEIFNYVAECFNTHIRGIMEYFK